MRVLRQLAGIGVAFAMAGYALAEEPEDLVIARQALRDGLGQVARSHAERVPGDTAGQIILESYAAENRWKDVEAYLTGLGQSATNAAFAYYRAVVDGRLDDAIGLLHAGASVEGVAEAKMLEADLLVRKGDSVAAQTLWREVAAMTNAPLHAWAIAGVNLGDTNVLHAAYARVRSLPLRRKVGLRLGERMLDDEATEAAGERLIRALVADCPDAEGAREAFYRLAAVEARRRNWEKSLQICSDAIEIWPDAVRDSALQGGRGEALFRLGRREDALAAFTLAESCATSDVTRAEAVLKQGDVLAELGRGAESMARYRMVLEKYPETETAIRLRDVVRIREMESQGRDLYRDYHFEEAMRIFSKVAEADPERVPRMAYFEVLCLYGLGRDEQADRKARALATDSTDAVIRSEALLWTAKFAYNRGEWREACTRFLAFADQRPDAPVAQDALLWATRAAFAANDLPLAIQTATRLAERHPESAAAQTALVVQSEALIEKARFDEAVLVLERVIISPRTGQAERHRASVLKADALFAMGADNAQRYEAALETYRAACLAEGLSADERLPIAFKIGRTLEKLNRQDEATDQYYSQVVLAYRDARAAGEHLGDEARAAFSRAGFRLADEFTGRGRDPQAIAILTLVAESGVPAAEEAKRRIERIMKKGRFL